MITTISIPHKEDSENILATTAGLTHLLLSAGHLLEMRLDPELHTHGPTTRQYRSLRYIGEHPDVTRGTSPTHCT